MRLIFLALQSTWHWSQSNTGEVVADVAYDLFTSNTAGGSNVNEIMIWLANVNSGPISAVYNAAGHAVPIVKNISIEGHTWC
jgi:xyloglucan-specific endo-beta-1,4-glucanase